MAAASKNRPIIAGGRGAWTTPFLKTPARVARRNAATTIIATKGAKTTKKR